MTEVDIINDARLIARDSNDWQIILVDRPELSKRIYEIYENSQLRRI